MFAMKSILFAMATGFSAASAFAADTQFLVWKDATGLQQINGCQIQGHGDIPFGMLSHPNTALSGQEELIDSNGKSMGQIPDRSLLQIMKPSQHQSGTKVRLIHIPANANKANPETLAKPYTHGMLRGGTLETLDSVVIELLESKGSVQMKDGSTLDLNHTYWQVAMQSDQYLIYTCGKGKEAKKYVAFNVFNASSLMPQVQVGIAATDLNVFSNINTFTSEEAERILNHEDGEEHKDSKTPSESETTGASPGNRFMDFAKKIGLGFLTGNTSPEGKAAETGAPPTEEPDLSKPLPAGPPSQPNAAPTTTPDTGATAPTGAQLPQAQLDQTVQPMAADAEAPKAATGTLEYVVCTQDGPVSLRDKKLEKTSVLLEQFESVKEIQDWDKATQKDLVQVQSGKDAKKMGWIPKKYFQLKSACQPYLAKNATAKQPDNKAAPKTPEAKKTEPTGKTPAKISGLNDSACCVFPLTHRPTDSYKEGMRRFRAGRGGGSRLHAACDLYGYQNDKVVAVANGKVIRDLYYFYQGVYALEVQHSGGFVVRYGEIKGRTIEGASQGERVNPGQLLGYVGRVNSGCCEPMLHFELYSGEKRGSLSQFDNHPFQRRSDLMNPTNYLSRWEQAKFGDSY